MGILPGWERQRWLEPHVVVVLDIRVQQRRIRQVAIARAEAPKLDDLRRRGPIIDQALVPTRFHATLLAHRVLSEMAPWRFQAQPHQVGQGFTQAWMADSPATELTRWASELEPADAGPGGPSRA